jgi:acyl carrier protein/NAD(P)-dependent dehydrogenase (short-subunit alcohol dehydrogenase family)
VAYRNGQRYVRQYSNYFEGDGAPKNNEIKIKKYGTYLITGGLGGVGLVFAEFLAREYSANIILISRTALPPESQWEEYLSDNSTPTSLHEKLLKLKTIKSYSVQLKCFAADVGDNEKIEYLLTLLEQENCTIDGVFHAATTVPQGSVQSKNAAMIEACFAAKVFGLSSLLKVFAHKKLDFLVLFSALSVTRGSTGAIDYIASCAFLDMVAESQSNYHYDFPIISVNWDAWNETGIKYNFDKYNAMAAKNASLMPDNLHYILIKKEQYYNFIANHKLDGKMLIPAAATFEMVRDELSKYLRSTYEVRLSSCALLMPGFVEDLSLLQLRLAIDETKSELYLEMQAQQRWLPILRGFYEPYNENKPDNILEKINRFSNAPRISMHTSAEIKRRAEVDEQWDVIEWCKNLDDQYLAKINISEKYVSKAGAFMLYPPALDEAISFYTKTLTKQYLPYFVGRFVCHTSLPRSFYSLISNISIGDNQETISYDIQLLDVSGNVIVSIQNLIFRHVDAVKELRGLSNQEGIAVFKEILRTPKERIIVSKRGEQDFSYHTDEHQLVTGKLARSAQYLPTVRENHEQTSEPTVSAQSQTASIEDGITTIWRDALDLEHVGAEDNFFNLGGDSLFAVQICYKIKKGFDIDISPNSLLDRPVLKSFIAYALELMKVAPTSVPESFQSIAEKNQVLPSTEEANMTGKKNTSDLMMQVKHIWCESLDLDSNNVSWDKDFFALGGDSLFAVQVCYKIKKTLGIDVSPNSLLDRPKLKAFADYVANIYHG